MGKKVGLSLLVAAALLTLTGCRVSEATAVQEVVEPTQPEPTDSPVPEEPTVQAEETPVAVFGQVGYVPGAFPTMGGDTWEFTDMQSESCGGGINTNLVKQERFTPLSEGGCVVSILAEGANDTTFYLVPRLDQAQYRKPDETVGTAKYELELSSPLVSVYADGGQVIYRQPGAMAYYTDGTVPILGRDDETGDVWVFYVGNDGSIVRRAPVFFGGQDTVQVVNGKVLVNGDNMLISTDAWTETPTHTTCLDPEFQEKVVEGFLTESGYESLESFYDTVWDSDRNASRDEEYFSPKASWAGLVSYTNKWTHGRNFLLLGSADISIANLPGADVGDYANCVFVGDPRMPDKLVPVVLAVERRGLWGITTTLTDSEHLAIYAKGQFGVPIQTQEDLDQWVASNTGYPVSIGLLMRFRNWGDWSSIQSENPLYDPPEVVKEVMELMGELAYFKYYTLNPQLLGPPMRPRSDGSVVGEQVDLEVVLENLNPAVDIGLFPDIVHLPTDRFP